METIILLLAPTVISWFTQLIKSLQRIKFSANKVVILRFVALTLSFAGSVLSATLAGEDVPLADVTTYVDALLVFIASQVPYLYGTLKAKMVK